MLLLFSSNVSFAQQKKVIGYIPTWASFPNIVNTLELNKLTHLNIAFANPNSSGMLTGPSNSSVTTVVNAAHAKGVKVFISIGGAGANGAMYQAQLNNTTSMNNFVNNLVQYTMNLNLDGIDVDIEGDVLNGSTVNATQYQNFIVKLGTELRARNKQMTAALAGWFAQHVTNTAAAQFDWINIMSYDAAGSWSGPGQHSPYSLAVNDFNFWKNSKGVPAAKLVIGVPFYGYGWGVYGNNGAGQYIAYSTIIDNHGGSINSDQVGSGNNVIYYNGIPTIKSKANYALQQNAGGIMIWEMSQDLSGTRSLLNAIYEVLGTSNPPIPQGPYNGVRTNLPGRLEAEHYDVGGQSVAYNDLTVGNEGNTFRTDDVDIQATTDAGAGNNVGWLTDGEWMEYSVNVTTAGSYSVEFRTASTSGGAIRMELDGADVTGTVALPNTTAWQTWATTTKTNVTLSAGQHLIRLFVITGGFNLNYINVVAPPNQAPTVSITTPIANANFTAPATISIAANASDADGSIAKVEFYNGATKLGEDVTSPYSYSWTNVSAGTYSITARATDNNNAATTSGVVSVTVNTPPNNCPNMTWSDEFNGASLDMSKWNYQTGDGCPNLCGWGNNELEYYTSSTNNISVSGGNLNITARYEPNYNGTGKNYTSGKLVTLGKFSQKYGRYEARIKVPSTAGIWPAFWMLADNTSWPATGEIDILECANTNPTTWFGTLHYGTPSGGYQHKGTTWNSPVPLSNDFHTYAAEWTTDKISWYVDGVHRGTVTKTELVAGGGSWPFDAQKFYIILNLAVGGNFAGQTPISSQYPVSMLVDYVKVYSGDPCTEQQAPFNNTVAAIPGTIQAENYDLGGQGVAYHDNEAANQGIVYRTDGVDVEATTDAGGGYNVGWTATGEWLEYTVNVASTGNYDAAIRTAGTAASALRIEVDGIDKTGTITLPNTTGWQNWATTTKTNIALTAGQHIMRVFVVTGGFNLNSIVFTPTPIPQSPYNNVMVSLPGKIEAENYDLGGQGIAYNDSETANQGTSYRTDGVDVQATTDAGAGYNVGWTTDGEWLEYTVTVAASGAYDLGFRTASTGGGAIRMEVDGVDISGTVTLPNTTGWQIWATTNKNNVTLSAGQHVVRLFVVTGGFNLNYVTVTPHVDDQGPGFLHASGKNIVNDQGNFIIRAANIGNMMVQEGYMLNLGGGYQHNIMKKIADVVGEANKDQFYNNYRNNYLTKADIDSLAKWGFNSIRLPMHYNLFTPLGQPTVFHESGFAKVDEIIGWCKTNNMYVILDLHAAPGGQSSGDISDYVAGQPSLWESAANRAQTVALWKKFAERYVNEQYVGGYDLINETNWTLPGNTLLAQLMKDITVAIRQVDQNHLLFIEGNSYANDYTGLTPKWDNNMAYSFHKYWNDVNDASVNWVLALRDAQNVPIWLGEYGENSNHWIAETVTLMNRHNIGWAIWPYKKMSSISCIGSFKEPANWAAMASYINGGVMPSAATAQAILNELAENVKISNTTVNYGYLYALFGASNNSTRAYTPITLPGTLSAAKYDEGKNGQAYSDVVHQTAQFGSGGGSFTAWNTGYAFRNDGVDLQFSVSENTNTVGWTENNEWMHYTVNVATTGFYTVKARVAGNGGTISLASDGVTLINAAPLAATGGWDTWQMVTLGNVSLSAGTHKLRITINTAGYNLNFLEFTTNTVTNQAPSVSFSSPSNNTNFNAPATISISANASDADGTISRVEFFNGATKLGEDLTAPYSYSWSNVAVGTYSITVRATDNNGAITNSAAITVKVITVITNPCGGVAQYVENGGYVAGSKVQNAGGLYECKPHPYSGWCNGAAWAYGPGTGTYWSDAWTKVNNCNAKVGETEELNGSYKVTSLNSSPNPFNSITKVEVSLAQSGDVSLEVYDNTGVLVMVLYKGYLDAGSYSYEFDSGTLKSDLYLVKLNSNQQIFTQKIIKIQ